MSKEILLVEDTLTQAMLFQHLLEKNGQSVKLARSGAKALELLEKLHHLNELPALILTDINMPDMNGYELCRALKTNSAFAHIQVVLFASATTPGEIAEILNCGADNIVLKKWDEQKLVKKLKLLVDEIAENPDSGTNSGKACELTARIGGKNFEVSFEPARALAIMSSLYEFLCTD